MTRDTVRLVKRTVSLASMLFLFQLPTTAPGQVSLTTEIVDDGAGQVLRYSSIALDGNDVPHFAYYNASTGDLEYATGTSGAWNVETVDGATSTVGEWCSIAIDPAGDPHISYFDGSLFELRYALKSGGTWQVELVDSSSVAKGQYSSIAVDDSGDPHISYYDASFGDLMYATKSAGVWTITRVDSTTTTGRYTAIALDADGNPHIAYRDWSTERLKYAELSGGTWTVEDAFTVSFGHEWIDLVLDTNGDPHVSFRYPSALRPVYATKATGAWEWEYVENVTGGGYYTSIAVDSANDPHVTYYRSGQLAYAVKTAGVWAITLIPYSGTSTQGNWTSIVLDGSDSPHISSHRSSFPYRLDYTRCCNTSPPVFTNAVTNADQEIIEGETLAPLDAVDPDNTVFFFSLSGQIPSGIFLNTSTGAFSGAADSGSVGFYEPLFRTEDYGVPALSDTTFMRIAVRRARLLSPLGGEEWQVGSEQTIEWRGFGDVEFELSVDGGATYLPRLAFGVHAGDSTETQLTTIRVPHVPTRFARLRVHLLGSSTEDEFNYAYSDSFFTIMSDIALLSLRAEPQADGVLVTWSTDPGPEALEGYRLHARKRPNMDWELLADGIRETRYLDADGSDGTRYRLFGVNGLGHAMLLGETGAVSLVPLAVRPLPYRGGELEIAFASTGGLGGGPGRVFANLYDISGRLVRTLFDGELAAGRHGLSWDGTNETGRRVSSGIYFVRVAMGGHELTHRVVVVR